MPYRGRERRQNFKRGRFNKPRSFNRNSTNRQFFCQESFTEKEVGITEYLSNLEGFSGIIKARYSDFHVNEISNSGEIAKLTNILPPSDFEIVPSNNLTEDVTLLSEETWSRIKELSTNENAESFEIDADSFTKEHRTKIYETIRSIYGKDVLVQTRANGERKVMHFKRQTSGCPVDTRFQWPADKGDYVYFLVHKEAVDTMEATFKISDCLRMKSSLFTYAGVKDKRAKTTQWFCVKKVPPNNLINRTKKLRNIHVGNVTFHKEPLKLGQLRGNQFQIALRNITASKEIIEQAIESLERQGFINYYGLQRFGNDKEVPTFKIGVALLRGQWKEACNLILNPKKSEDPCSEIAQAKRVFKETSNSNLANNEFCRWYNKCVESKLLLGFVKNHENDYVNALDNIPRNMRLLYLHSFQSLIWNQMASRRIKEFGMKPIPGDLVLITEDNVPVFEFNLGDIETDHDIPNGQEIKVLTEDDLSSYSIYDIVLPLPGFDIKYPENILKTWYKESLENYGLSLELPRQKVKTYNISGAYRKILARVNSLSWKILKYNHPNDVLIRSDFEELIGKEEPQDNPEGQYTGLVLNFCLESSCYATMVLREILKIDTSTSQQSKLNEYHLDQSIGSKYEDQSQLENEGFLENESLLSNPIKYDEFKRDTFTSTAIIVEKHKSEENLENCNKKLKSSEENDCGIKIQPSLL